MQQFFINQNATMPYLEIEPVQNGRSDVRKLYYAVQSAKVSFTMTNVDTGIKKIANAPCEIVKTLSETCSDNFKIRYKWNKRDTNAKGTYKAEFRILFDGNIESSDMEFPVGELIVPISEELIVVVK